MSQIIPNSFQTPNLYVDKLIHLLTDTELRVLMYMTRRILGFSKTADRISLSQLTDGITSRTTGEHLDHGAGVSKEAARTALESMVSLGIIVQTKPHDRTKNLPAEWSLQLDDALIDMQTLNARKAASNEAGKKRSAKRKASKPSAPVLTASTGQPIPTASTDLSQPLVQTYPNHLDRPVLTDNTHNNQGNTEETQGESGGEDARRSLPDIPFELPPPPMDDAWIDLAPDQLQPQLQAEEQPKHRNGYVKEQQCAPIPSSEPPLPPSRVTWERRKVITPNAERVKEAQSYGVDPRTLRTMTDVVLDMCGRKALADAGDDRALNDAQETVIMLMRMDERFRSVTGIESVAASWEADDYRGRTPPTPIQVREQASRMLAGKANNKFERSNERAKTTTNSFPSIGRAPKFEELDYVRQLNVLSVRGEIDDEEYERRLQAYNARNGATAIAQGSVPVSRPGLLRS